MITEDIELCSKKLSEGELVAFPTETVFGLGARADRPQAVKKIFTVKERPETHPLISHTNNTEKALSVSTVIPQYARALAKAFWPGPMTLILSCENDDVISPEARGGHDTVAVRVPSHPMALALLEKCDFFVAAPSANRFGRVSPTTAQHVNDEFGNDLTVLDGGQSEVGVESTIISCLESRPQVLRAGKISEQEIYEATKLEPISDRTSVTFASGTMENHYAPSIPLYLFDSEVEIPIDETIDPSKSAFVSLQEPELVFAQVLTPIDVNEYAHDLYAFVRKAELSKCECICAIAPPMIGIGVAVNDRLKRASNRFNKKST